MPRSSTIDPDATERCKEDESLRTIGIRMGEALAAKRDWDIFCFCHPDNLRCVNCGKLYLRWGWLVRHYKQTNHWKNEVEV